MEKHLPNTQIETDSYIAVQLLEQQGKLNFDSLKSMAESVQGSFALRLWTKTTRSTSSKVQTQCVCSTLHSWDFTFMPRRKVS